jgi:hypothetical protein
MRYAWLLLILVLATVMCGCDEGDWKRLCSTVEGVVKDVRITMTPAALQGDGGQSASVHTVVTFTDDRTIMFKGASPQPIPLDSMVKIYYRSDRIVAVELSTAKGTTPDNDNGETKGVKPLSN